MVQIDEIRVQQEHDLLLVRHRMQRLTQMAGLPIGNQARLTTTVAQAAESLYHYCGRVLVSLEVAEHDGQHWLQATLTEADGAEARSVATLSRADLLTWLDGMHLFVQNYSVYSEAGEPIRVVAAKPFPTWQKTVTEETLEAWREKLRQEPPRSPVQAILEQNQSLVQVLNELRAIEADLRQKIREVEALEQMRDDLVHALVHDLRNPLASIRSSLSGLLYDDSSALNEYQHAMVEISYLSAKKMSGLVENILDVYKLERDGLQIDPQPIAPGELIEGVLRQQAPLAREKNIRLTLEAPDFLPSIAADRDLVERMVQNLLDNALKFTPENGQIVVSALARDPEGSEGAQALVVRVADSGPGIEAGQKPHLFEKFTTGKREESGSGIGLAFCKLAVQAHGGEIWVDDSAGPGATFAFMLPVARENHREGRDDG